MPVDSGALILGAGFSRRFGGDKRLAQLNDVSVAELTLQSYCQVFSHVRVVVKPEDGTLISLIEKLNVEIIRCPEARQGMGHSLACGVRELSWAYAFVGLLDMPFIKTETLNQLKQAALNAPPRAIIQPRLTEASVGHPVGWPRHYYPLLAQLHGDQGARVLLKRFQDKILYMATDDEGVIADIDRPEDLQHQP
ncbi:MAG: nucleotidyltransferase family protein [Pseudomonadaceae bacterium]|nr:nucleotidyltransferase family protein [Pseudomonadaceae bacterium]